MDSSGESGSKPAQLADGTGLTARGDEITKGIGGVVAADAFLVDVGFEHIAALADEQLE